MDYWKKISLPTDETTAGGADESDNNDLASFFLHTSSFKLRREVGGGQIEDQSLWTASFLISEDGRASETVNNGSAYIQLLA